MKKIALIMESWGRYFTFAWPSGMLRKIRSTSADIDLYIFNCNANWNDDAMFNKGEHNIFELPELTAFDGIIVDLTNTRDSEAADRLLDRIRRSGVPAISIANRYDGLYYVSVDNYSAMCDIFDHLYDKHGCRTFRFIMGPEENYENSMRSRALIDKAAEKGLPESSYTMHYYDYDVNSGVRAFREMRENNEGFPDAVICANDNIAVGFLLEAQSMGFDAPADFLITGFDDLDKSRYFTPRISTVSYMREDIGELCVDMLMKIWAGQTVPETCYISSHPVFWESCGCTSDIAVDLRQHAKDSIIWNIDSEYFANDVVALDSRLSRCGNMGEMIKCIPAGIPTFRCDAMYLVVDKLFEYINYGDVESMEPVDISGFEKELHSVGYPEEMTLIFSYENGLYNECRKSVRGLVPTLMSDEKPSDILFLPIHLRERCIGYFAIKNAVYLMEKQFIFGIMNALISGIEQLHERTKLAVTNKMLSAMYHHDTMTKFWNRSGFTDCAQEYFNKFRAEGRRMAVIYYDLDRLKWINDTFGHDEGDRSIRLTAKAIGKNVSDEAMCFRLGGDEFLVLDRFVSDQELNGRCSSISEVLHDDFSKGAVRSDLTISAGYTVTDPLSDETLEDYVKRADDMMYSCKKAKKMNRK